MIYPILSTRSFKKIPTPHTGFEPASHYGPTVFKTAPSPPGHTAYYIIRAMRIELILTGSKPDAPLGFLRNPIAPLTGFGVPLRYAPITTAEGLEPPMQFSCNTGTRSRRLTIPNPRSGCDRISKKSRH